MNRTDLCTRQGLVYFTYCYAIHISRAGCTRVYGRALCLTDLLPASWWLGCIDTSFIVSLCVYVRLVGDVCGSSFKIWNVLSCFVLICICSSINLLLSLCLNISRFSQMFILVPLCIFFISLVICVWYLFVGYKVCMEFVIMFCLRFCLLIS